MSSAMKRSTIYAHYDEHAEVKRYVLHTLRALREVSDRIVFVSTSPLNEAEQAKVAPLVDEIVLRDNVGYDFAMWQQALLGSDLIDSSDEILLLNSSVFGPATTLRPLFERMAGSSADFWGLTENYEFHWHLQSYFVVFRRSCLEHPAFRRFWESVLSYRRKQQVICSYEFGLSQYLIENGLKAEAAYSHANVRGLGPLERWRARRANPSLWLARGFIQAGMPFMKLELLRLRRLWWRALLARRAFRQAGYDCSLMEVSARPGT